MKSLFITLSLCLILGLQHVLAQPSEAAFEKHTTLKSKADSLYKYHRFDQAIPLYEQLLKQYPDSVALYEPVTKSYAYLGLFDKAEQLTHDLYFSQPYDDRYDPDMVKAGAHCRFALFKTMQQEYKAALAHVDSMLTLSDPSMIYPGGPACAFRFETRAGAYERASDNLEKLLEATSGLARAQFLPWAIYVARQLDNHKHAEELLHQATSVQQMIEGGKMSLGDSELRNLGPSITEKDIYYWLAEVNTLRDNKQAAIAALQRAHQLGHMGYYRWRNENPIFQSLASQQPYQTLMNEMKADMDSMRQQLIPPR